MSKSSQGTALHLAAEYDRADAAGVLVEADAEVNASSGIFHGTPLHNAARFDNCDAMLALLRHSVNVNTRDIDRFQPIHEACRELRPGEIDLLLHTWPEVRCECLVADITTSPLCGRLKMCNK